MKILPENETKYSYITFGFTFLGFIYILLNMIHRVQYGIDFTDESWYVAEPYLVAKGATPYTDLWSQASGFTIPLAFMYRIYLLINGSTEGIVLFSRMLFVVWSMVVGMAAWKLCKKLPFALFLPILCVAGISVYDITYNTIGIYYSFLATVILFVRDSDASDREQLGIGILAGVLLARSFIGTPVTICVVGLSLLFVLAQKRLKTLLGIITGGILSAVTVVGYCCIKGEVLESFFMDCSHI